MPVLPQLAWPCHPQSDPHAAAECVAVLAGVKQWHPFCFPIGIVNLMEKTPRAYSKESLLAGFALS
jgi:hypothetical protein